MGEGDRESVMEDDNSNRDQRTSEVVNWKGHHEAPHPRYKVISMGGADCT